MTVTFAPFFVYTVVEYCMSIIGCIALKNACLRGSMAAITACGVCKKYFR